MITIRMQKIFSHFQKTWMRWLLFLSVLLAWFIGFQPWGSFSDPDAFYHSTMAAIMLKQGLIQDFYWLDLTSFAHPFFNQHFLFHVALVPFVAVFGALLGGQIAAVCFAILFCLVFAWCLKKLQSPAPLFWTLVMATMPAMTARLSYGKASPFAVGLFILGVTALISRSRWLGFFSMMLFVLSHAGWPLLILAQGALLVGHALYLCAVDSVPFWRVFCDKEWLSEVALFFTTLLGAIVGIALHPYRAELFVFLKVQLFQIGIATPYDRVIMGNEWYGISPLTAIAWYYVLLVCFGFFAFGLLVARRAANRQAMRYVIMLAVPTIFLLALNLKSARFVEYSAPLLVLLMAQLFHLIDVKKTWRELQKTMRPRYAYTFAITLVSIFGYQSVDLFWTSHSQNKSFHYYAGAMSVIKNELQPGDRLFHSDWSHMPILWAENQDIRYVAGLDPTFLLTKNPELSDRYTELTLGRATSTAYEVIAIETQSKAVFVDRARGTAFESALKADQRFELLYEDDRAAVYRVH